MIGFNTQPHEGGCRCRIKLQRLTIQFQHTAARRRLLSSSWLFLPFTIVSTHSRTKAAAKKSDYMASLIEVSTHSRTKAAAIKRLRLGKRLKCFNTQPHEGGCLNLFGARHPLKSVSTHSRTKAAAETMGVINKIYEYVSTHSRTKAAARYYLHQHLPAKVSTHSRTKAAASVKNRSQTAPQSFNTQPHEGGCSVI